MSKIDLSDYVPVSERIAQFKEAHPGGRLESEVIDAGFPGFVAVKAYAYKSPDDLTPGVGLAWEPVPGPTPFTKDSELQNAETAAWGRALIAGLIADASRGIASRDEVARSQERPTRKADQTPPPAPVRTDPELDPKQWLADSVAMFGLWTPEQKKKAGNAAMADLGFKNPLTMEQAKQVVAHMTATYYEDKPDALPF
jgi:hypothetical protein